MVDFHKTQKFVGFMVEAEWDGRILRIRGTNKSGQLALRGHEAALGDVVLWRDEMKLVTFKHANPLVNGNLTIHTWGEKKYRLNFRRKQTPAFVELAAILGAST